MKTKTLSDADKMRAMRAAGMPVHKIAAAFGCSPTKVYYAIDPEFVARHRAKTNARQKAKRRERGLKPTGFQTSPVVTSDAPVYDGGPVWIEDRKVQRSCANSQDRKRAIERYRKTGSTASSKRPENQRQTAQRRTLTRLSAIHAYLAGDRSALREYLESVGR